MRTNIGFRLSLLLNVNGLRANRMFNISKYVFNNNNAY
jgi:hypothetical protein